MSFHVLQLADDVERLEWAEGVEYETVSCPVDAGHRRAGRRKGRFALKAPSSRARDREFHWSWEGECVVQPHVARELRERFTGVEFAPAELRGPSGQTEVFELIVVGWGGMAAPASGVKPVATCSACGHATSHGLVDPGMLMAPGSDDGSDFLIVWPYPAVRIVRSRVADFLRVAGWRGVATTPLSALNLGGIQGAAPGRLVDWMNPELAELRARDIPRR